MVAGAEAVALCKESMKTVSLAGDAKSKQDGKDFYKFFFTNYPELRKYFKGAENFTAADVQGSERFEKNGMKLNQEVDGILNKFTDDAALKAFAKELMDRHVQFKMDPALWSAVWSVYTGFLNERNALNDKQRDAWTHVGQTFNSECQAYLKSAGLPHV